MSLVAVAAALVLGQTQMDPNIVTWRTYKDGAVSAATDQQIVEIENLAEYQRYLNQFHPEGAGDGRDIAWGKEELVAIHIGTRRSGGYGVEVSTIKKVKPTEACVFWNELTPVPGLSTSRGDTSPWTIVRLNRPGAKLTFSGGKQQGRLPGGIQIINFPGFDEACHCCDRCMRAHRNRLPWRVYASGDDAPVLMASNMAMNSQDDFLQYVKNYKMAGLGAGADVDWSRERLVAIHLGRKITPGYSILVDHVDFIDGNRMNISYSVCDESAGIASFTTTGPYVIVRVPRVGGVVSYSKADAKSRVRRSDCDCGCDDCRYCGKRE